LLFEHEVARAGKIELERFAGGVAVGEQGFERALAPVEIDREHFLARIGQRHATMKRQSRFPDSAFFIRKNNDVRVGHRRDATSRMITDGWTPSDAKSELLDSITSQTASSDSPKSIVAKPPKKETPIRFPQIINEFCTKSGAWK
jgi:hypothetical protein